jgi:three-Cys-motif partner protein
VRATDNFFERKREWSRLKDRILGTYLKPYLAKITMTRRPTLVVDCFAGKGRFDDGEPGSPVLICQAIRTARETRPSADVQGLFIEKKYHAELQESLREFDQVEILPGTYEEHMAKVERRIECGTNLLMFVDPYGIKSLDMSRFQRLANTELGSIELIMNLTAFGFLREGCRLLSIEGFDCEEDSDVYEDDPDSPNTVERMNAIASGSYWMDVLREYHGGAINMSAAERDFVTRYLANLRELFPYVVDIPVQYRRGHLPKYRLIYGTRSADGLVLMADNMSRVWHDFVHRDRGGQEALFEEIDYPDMVALEGYSLEDDVLEMSNDGIELKELLVRLMVKYGITFPEGELKRRIRSMEQEGALTIRRDPPVTPRARRASTSMNYREYRIRIERKTSG